MNTHVLFAVFKRNFVSYFANPTGYVFICVFVLLSSAATFWPSDFFNNNLANLDQLSYYFR
jgi:ABC-2 type transport system permease protein